MTTDANPKILNAGKDTVILFHPRTYPGPIISAVPYEFLNLGRMLSGKLRLVLIDEQLEPDYLPQIRLNAERLLLAGVSTMTGYQLHGAREFSKAVKQYTEAPVVWGSWHPSLLTEEVLREDFVDFTVSGQGEPAFERLTDALLTGSAFSDIPNLGYKNGGNIMVNPRGKIRNPNDFPPIDFSLIDVARYNTKKRFSEKTMWYFASFGCPNACGFCSMANVFGRGWWHRPVGEVITHLKYLKEKSGMGAVRFEDPTFFVKRDFTLELCRRMIEENLDILWHANASASRFLKLFSVEDVKLMYRAGLRQVFIGAESGDEEVLEKINKESTVKDNLDIVRLLKRGGVKPNYAIMVCFPWDPEKDFRNTMKMVMKAKLIDRSLDVSLNFFKPVPGTPLYDTCLRYGFKPPADIDGWIRYMMVRFKAPWYEGDFLVKMRIIKRIYFPLMTPGLFRKVQGWKKIVFLLLVIWMRPMVYLRFLSGNMSFPWDGYILYYSIRWFNRLTGLNWGMGKSGKEYKHKDL